MMARYLIISYLITTVCINASTEALYRLGEQRGAETKLRKEEGEKLKEAVKALDFNRVFELYKESERVKFKLKAAFDTIGSNLLCLAAFFGDTEIVSLLLDADLPIDARDTKGNTALMWASAVGTTDLVKLLLERGADSSVLNEGKKGALDWALYNGQSRVVFILVEHQMSKDTERYWKPLPWCMKSERYDIARLLLEAPLPQVQPDEKDSEGDTALMWAVKKNQVNMVKFFIFKGASAQAVNRKGETPLSIALDRVDHNMIFLLAGQAAKAENLSSLAWAARHGHAVILRSLLKQEDVTVDVVDKGGNTPLHWAVGEGYHAIAIMLVRAGAQPDKHNIHGISPIALATQKGDTQMLTVLNTGSTVLEDQNEYGWTLLMKAARYGYLDTVQELLNQKDKEGQKVIDVDQLDKDKNTALHWAARFGHTDVVRLLLDHGASHKQENTYQWTPLYWAVRNKHAAVVRLLLDKGAKPTAKEEGFFMAYCKSTRALRNYFVKQR